jgi:hypothetical protein
MMRSARVLLVLALAAASVGASVDAASARNTAPTVGAKAHVVAAKPALSSHLGIMPKSVGKKPTTTAAVATKTLSYYGGKIIQNVKVVQVLYGAGTYAPYVAATGAGTTGAFYNAVVGSSHVTWLNNDYKTTTPVQNIGAGTFAGQVQITPSTANTPSTQSICTTSGAKRIKDTQIQAELKLQIAAGKIPAPDANTYYAIYFPANVGIQQGKSCSGVQFCAYHGTVAASTGIAEFYYGILPDFTSAAFATGCGGSTQYNNVTSVSSHELIEAITDPEVGLAKVVGKPLAWYNVTYGEIGDICNGQQGSITGTDGVSYVVQTEWSNTSQACRV